MKIKTINSVCLNVRDKLISSAFDVQFYGNRHFPNIDNINTFLEFFI